MRLTAAEETRNPCSVARCVGIVVLVEEAVEVACEFGGNHVLVELVGKVLNAGSLHDGVDRPVNRLFVHILVSHGVAS